MRAGASVKCHLLQFEIRMKPSTEKIEDVEPWENWVARLMGKKSTF